MTTEAELSIETSHLLMTYGSTKNQMFLYGHPIITFLAFGKKDLCSKPEGEVFAKLDGQRLKKSSVP
jgi:hypothetical protein